MSLDLFWTSLQSFWDVKLALKTLDSHDSPLQLRRNKFIKGLELIVKLKSWAGNQHVETWVGQASSQKRNFILKKHAFPKGRFSHLSFRVYPNQPPNSWWFSYKHPQNMLCRLPFFHTLTTIDLRVQKKIVPTFFITFLATRINVSIWQVESLVRWNKPVGAPGRLGRIRWRED